MPNRPPLPYAYEDTDIMPFGAHIDKRLEDVPAQYLLFLWDSWLHTCTNQKHRRYPLYAYVYNNYSALQMDAPDYIPTHPLR